MHGNITSLGLFDGRKDFRRMTKSKETIKTEIKMTLRLG